tara:strand:- start:14236 stop:14634 length:399 start_codon:yes stop_codon:yes gene_type:complete
MRFTLLQILEQAKKDTSSLVTFLPYGLSVIGGGVKIQSFESKTEILNCSKGGHYYKEIENEEYEFFLENGWRKGKVYVSINNCIYKLNLIENRMKIEMNTRKNDKHIQNLKTRRDNLLVKYASNKQNLTELN